LTDNDDIENNDEDIFSFKEKEDIERELNE